MIPVDLGSLFIPRFVLMCERVKCAPFDLLRPWQNESGVTAKAHNASGHASGLYQAMPDTLRGEGFHGANGYTERLGAYAKACDDEKNAARRKDANAAAAARLEKDRLNAVLAASFRTISAVDQLPWAERFYRPYMGKLVSSAACYVATFLPADLDLAANPEAVLSAKAGSSLAPDGRRAWAFDLNAGFDANHDMAIQVRELDEAIVRACRGGRWAAIEAALRQELGLEPAPPPEVVPAHDLRSTLGIQEALSTLGYDPGPLDGIPGKLTTKALVLFQSSAGISADGIPGPITRKALADALFPPALGAA